MPRQKTPRHVADLSHRETPLSRRYLRILEDWIPTGLQYWAQWPDRPRCGHFLGGRVDEETWGMLREAHVDYARRFGTMPPRHGVYYDIQMKENGWPACGLASVECLLPEEPQAET